MNAPAASARWARICGIMTDSIKRHGCFNWIEIQDLLDETEYEKSQWIRGGEHVWVVDHTRVNPSPRRSILDHADVVSAELYGKTSRHRILPAEPDSNISKHKYDSVYGIEEICVKRHERRHHISREAILASRKNFMFDVIMSFYNSMILGVEAELFEKLSSMPRGKLAFDDTNMYDVCARHSGHVEQNIARAAARIVEKNPGVAFPHGLSCMVTPERAGQLLLSNTSNVVRRSVHGLDMIITPAAKNGMGGSKYGGMVIANGAVGIAMSRLEISTADAGDGTSVIARYSAGVSVNPQKMAGVFRHSRD